MRYLKFVIFSIRAIRNWA